MTSDTARGISPDDIGPSFAPRAADHVAAVELDGEAVLYDEQRQTVHLLSPSATVLWNCFDGTGTIDEIATDIAEVFAADVAAIRDDALGVARGLGRQNLLDGVIPDPEVEPAEFGQDPELVADDCD
jgi:hypothetical protein